MMLRVYLFIVAFDFVVVARLLVWFSRNNMQISQAIQPQAPVQSSEMKAITTICC
jgi:hypothetical protein